jgi:hypothetical protein
MRLTSPPKRRHLIEAFRSMPTLSDKKGKKRDEYIALLARNLCNCSDRTQREVLGSLSARDRSDVLAALEALKKRA